MVWTEIVRRQYRRERLRYARGLSDTEWKRFGLDRSGGSTAPRYFLKILF